MQARGGVHQAFPWWLYLLSSVPTAAASVLIVVALALWAGPWIAGPVIVWWLLVVVNVVDTGWIHPRRSRWARALKSRGPIDSESDVLGAAWSNVSGLPGVDGWPYSLWVQESDEMNAFAMPTRVIVVTSWAVAELESRPLEAVLAHELGHHRLVDQRLRLLNTCWATPATVVRRVTSAIGRLLDIFGATTAIVIRFVLAAALLVLLTILLIPATGMPIAVLLSALLALEPLVVAARNRREEFAADQFSASLGYADALTAALRRRHRDLVRPNGITAVSHRLYDSHPSTLARLRALAS